MIRIKPLSQGYVDCGPGRAPIAADTILWQGIHVCAVTRRDGADHLARALPVGHSAYYPFTVDLVSRTVAGVTDELRWIALPLLNSLLAPKPDPVTFTREVRHERREVVIVNCLDWMYGHCLLKLLNAERHLKAQPPLGVIVLVPRFLRWMVPDGVAEVWTVDLGLNELLHYYPSLHQQISPECARFDAIYLSEAYSVPSQYTLARFTGVEPHRFQETQECVTFIWREDRPWLGEEAWDRCRKWHLVPLSLVWQRHRVQRLFARLKQMRPQVRCCVAGLGTSGRFPPWIEDHRCARFDEAAERATCQLYAESRLVLGLHGSNMLLPSGLAGMTLDLVPFGKWNCSSIDLLSTETEPRLALVRYKFLPSEAGPKLVAHVAAGMLRYHRELFFKFTEDHPGGPDPRGALPNRI